MQVPGEITQLGEDFLKAHIALDVALSALCARFSAMANWDEVDVAEAKCHCGNESSYKIRGVRPFPNDTEEYKAAYHALALILGNIKIAEPCLSDTPCVGCGRHHAYWMISRKS